MTNIFNFQKLKVVQLLSIGAVFLLYPTPRIHFSDNYEIIDTQPIFNISTIVSINKGML